MGDITTQTVLLGGIWVTLVFIGGVLVKILRGVNKIQDTVTGGSGGGTTRP